VLVGGFVFPVLAGLYYWTSQFSGRRSDQGLGVLAFWLVFIGFNLTFLIMHLTGLLGMPRRVYTYAEGLGWALPNLVSSIGGFILTIGFGLVLIDMLVQWRFAAHVPRNPWKAGTLEWAMAAPVPAYNFASLPHVDSREPVKQDPDLPAGLAAGKGYLPGRRDDHRETLGVDGVTGEPEQVILLPAPSYLPLFTALSLVGVALCFLFSVYWGAALLMIVVIGFALLWLWDTGLRQDPEPIDAGLGKQLLPHPAVEQAPGWWGMIFTIIFDATLFASLLFGYLFLWTIAPNWPPPEMIDANPFVAVVTLAGLASAGFAGVLSVRANRQGRAAIRKLWLLVMAVAASAAVASFAAVPAFLAPPATQHAYSASVLMLSVYGALHAGLVAVGALFVLVRCSRGFVSPMRSLDIRNLSLFCTYSAISGAIAVAAIHLMPMVDSA
jgi:cytochrome c oxidase subunit I+III